MDSANANWPWNDSLQGSACPACRFSVQKFSDARQAFGVVGKISGDAAKLRGRRGAALHNLQVEKG
jgi:hypothetical protein